jgi:histidinol-phosphate phosphatase family protein
MVKICFIDRDGVINKTVPRKNMNACAPWSLSQFEYLPRVQEAIMNIKRLDYITIVATNQPDPQDGLMSWDELNKINDKIRNDLEVDDIYMAHLRGHLDYKPNPGMLQRGIQRYNSTPDRCFMIGDSDKDIVAGYRAGINTIWVNNPPWELKESYKEKYGDVQPTRIVSSLFEASLFLY